MVALRELRLTTAIWIERSHHRRRRQQRLGKLKHFEQETVNRTRPPKTPSQQSRGSPVRLEAASNPIAIRPDGLIWVVDPGTDAQHSFGRHACWDTCRTAAVGGGDIVSSEYCQVQGRFGTSDSAVWTFTLRRIPLSIPGCLTSNSDGG